MDTNDKARAEAAVSKEAAKVSAQAAKKAAADEINSIKDKAHEAKEKGKDVMENTKEYFRKSRRREGESPRLHGQPQRQGRRLAQQGGGQGCRTRRQARQVSRHTPDAIQGASSSRRCAFRALQTSRLTNTPKTFASLNKNRYFCTVKQSHHALGSSNNHFVQSFGIGIIRCPIPKSHHRQTLIHRPICRNRRNTHPIH